MATDVKKPKERIFNKHFILLMILSLITSFGYSMISTMISSYSTDILGSTLSFAGVITGAYSLAAMFMRPVAGFAADFFSKRNICVYSTLGIGVIMLLYAVVPNPGSMLAVRILHGICFGIGGTANLAMASSYIPKDRMSEGLGYFGLGQILSQAFGPTVGLAVKNLVGSFHGLFIFISVATFIGVILVAFFFKNEKVERPKEKRKISIGDFVAVECIVYSLICAMFSLTNGVINTYLKQFAEQRSIDNFTLFFTVNAVVMFIIRTFLGRVFDKIKLLYVVDFSLIVTAIGMVLIGRAHVLIPLLLAGAMKAFGQGGGQISLQSACIKKVSPAKIGIATSTYYIGADIGNTVGPMLGGTIADAFNYEIMFYFTAGALILAFVVFNFYELHQMKKAKLSENKE